MPNETQTHHQPHPSTPGLHRYQMTLKLNINPAQVHLGFTDARVQTDLQPDTNWASPMQTTIRLIITPTQLHLVFTDANCYSN